MSLGDHVRITRTFLEAFKDAHEDGSEDNQPIHPDIVKVAQLQEDLKVCTVLPNLYTIIDVTIGIPTPAHKLRNQG